jgi:four helix bundle protein
VGESPFRSLVAYRLAASLADELHDAVVRWPSLERWTVGVQLIRAADSVGANIAEATGRWHDADKRRLLLIARGSVYELEHWLLRARTRRLINESAEHRLGDIARALNGLIRRQAPS